MNHKKIIFIISFLIIFSFLLSFNAQEVKAMTTAEIQALIAKLQAQIAALQKQLTETQGQQPAAWCYDFNVNLRIGDAGAAVCSLRTALQKEGFETEIEKTEEGCKFNEEMASAVSGLQQKYADEILKPLGLRYGTGFLGKSTRAKLNKFYGCGVKSAVLAPITVCNIFLTCEGGYTSYNTGEKDSQGCPIIKCVSTPTPVIPSVPITIPTISEQVKCVFHEATSKQECYSSNGNSCNGIEGCVVDVKGPKGERITWKSTCGGYAYTTIDGQNEYAEFKCVIPTTPIPTTPSITVLSPNGGESWIIGSTQNLRWNAPSNATMRLDLVDEQKQLMFYNLANVSGNPGSAQWSIPSYIPAGRYLVKAIACIGPTCSEGFVNVPTPTACNTSNCYIDYSDNYFSIVSGTATNLPDIQITDINPASVNQNQFTNYTATVKNNSSQNITTPFVVNLGGITTVISSLAAWQTATVNANFGLTILGPNQVCARVDIWNTVAESNESNNDFCKTVDVVTASVPSITVLSPNGGETWTFGKQYDIIWKSTRVKTASVYLWFSDGTTCKLADVPAENGKYSVQFTENQLCTTQNISIKITSGRYQIKIYTEDGKINDSSDNYFNIVSETSTSTAPIITVTYPNGGETWTKDMTYTVKWSVNGLFSQGSKRLTLEKSGVRVIQYSGNAENADLMNLTLSSSDIIVGNDYKIKIELVDTNDTVVASDISDNYFSIISSEAGLKDIENQLASISSAVSQLIEWAKLLLENR